MTKLSKDRLMKIHGINEPTGPADPAVLARRKYHEAAARWFDKASTPLVSAFVMIGLVLVLLPVLIDDWRAIVERLPIARTVFHEYSTLGGLAMIHFFILMFLYFPSHWLLKDFPAGTNAGLQSFRNIIYMELYPRTIREEVAYWINLIFKLSGTTIVLFLPFGVLAFFIRMGN